MSALGMASGEIKDYQLTASSTYSESQPNQARPSKNKLAETAYIAITHAKDEGENEPTV